MNDGATDTSSGPTLRELLRNPDDLHKIASLKSDFTRKKATIDASLKVGLAEQLQLTQAGMASLSDGQETMAEIKAEMMKIDRLCADARELIRNFPEINAVAQAHRNFQAVEAMQRNIEDFDTRLEGVMQLLNEDEDDPDTQPHLLEIHHAITRLREIRDDAMMQVQKTQDESLEDTLKGVFGGLSAAIEKFDEHVGAACMGLIPHVMSDNHSLVVRLAIIIEEEEKFDQRMLELQEAQKEFKDIGGKFTALEEGAHELRGYKDKFLEAIKLYAEGQIQDADEALMNDPDRLEKSLRWYFNDLNTVKKGMVPLMPKKWRIFHTYTQIYHKLLHEWLTNRASDKDITPPHMLAIIHWKDKYYEKMHRLGADPKDLDPPLPGGRDSDLVREYRQLIVEKVEQWMNQLNANDRAAFLARDESTLTPDQHSRIRTKTLGDMWRMLREQLTVASTAKILEITEGVIDAMFRALKTRQDMWTDLVNSELAKYIQAQSSSSEPPQLEGIQALQDWLIALANDQIVSIADADANYGQLGYLPAFQGAFAELVSPEYQHLAEDKVETLKEGMTDLGFRCITVFVRLIFAIDFRSIMADFFTPNWYAGKGGASMGAIISTFEDYLGDYSNVLHPLLAELLVIELSKKLLVAYLGAVRNKHAKFPRTAPYNERVKADVGAAFKFFERFPDVYPDVKEDWKVVSTVINLVEVDKHVIQAEFRGFVSQYWDVKVGWVESLLRCRDDIDWGPLGDGKSFMKGIRAVVAENREGRGPETIMADVG
ncbi:MAG: hypothetical protein Q9159_004458 [Coniocarpon cinnabarinum]